MKHAAVTLGSGNLRLAVMLPEGEDLNEWVAVNSMSSISVGKYLMMFYTLHMPDHSRLSGLRTVVRFRLFDGCFNSYSISSW